MIVNHGMLDIETLGTGSNAAITAIGLTIADTKGDIHHYYEIVNLQSSVDAGAEIDPSTVLWWMNQSDEARSIYKNNDKAFDLSIVLENLNHFVYEVCGEDTKGNADLKLWGNGVGFDNVILRNSYSSFKYYLDCPFAFYNDMCYRTLKNLYPEIKLERIGTHHNALDDALSQMDHLELILKEMGK